MKPFTSLPPTLRKSHLDQLHAEHSFLLQKEKSQNFAKRPPCPVCNQTHVYKVGVNPSGLTRYKCSDCKKSYTTRSGTPAHWLHLRSKFDKYLHSMLSEGHRSIKSMALEFNISIVTAFDWRHKILASLNCSPKQFQGLVELRNSMLPFSRKGIGNSKAAGKTSSKSKSPVQLIITADSENNASIQVARIGQLKASDIEVRLTSRIRKDAIVVNRIHESFNENNGLPIKQFGKVNHLSITQFSSNDNPFDLDDKEANTFYNNLNTLVFNKTRGVATKYLQHYADWTVLMRLRRDVFTKKSESYKNHNAWNAYTAHEERFRRFMKTYSNTEYVQTSHRIWKTAEK